MIANDLINKAFESGSAAFDFNEGRFVKDALFVSKESTQTVSLLDSSYDEYIALLGQDMRKQRSYLSQPDAAYKVEISSALDMSFGKAVRDVQDELEKLQDERVRVDMSNLDINYGIAVQYDEFEVL
jgi:hypothetical protein